MDYQHQFDADDADNNEAAPRGATVHGGVLRVQFGAPQPSEPAAASQVRIGGRQYIVNAASGEVRQGGVSRYQVVPPSAGAQGDIAAILATARTPSGAGPKEITPECIVRIQAEDGSVRETSIQAAMNAQLLPRNALKMVSAAPSPGNLQASAPGSREDLAQSAEQDAADALATLPRSILGPVLDRLTDPRGLGLTDEDFTAIERATSMQRDEFMGKLDLAISGFKRQMEGIVGAHEVDVTAFGKWAADEAPRELAAAVRENVEFGTDNKLTALVYRFKQQPRR